MNRLPTFIKGALEDYSKHRTVDDEYARYRSLENAFAITIKYVGTTLSLIAADYLGDDGRSEVWNTVFRSSGLGGWLDAARLVCKNSTRLPADVRDHCRDYTLYRQHVRRDVLSDVSMNLATIVEQLNSSYGYKLPSVRGASVLRALEVAVELRNKSAHGALKVTFFDRVEDALFSALKQLLDIMSFEVFEFCGRYGRSNAISFLEPGSIGRRARDAHVWVDSPLLKDGFTDNIPFVSYSEDARDIFFLNSAVYDGEAEYIDYRTGTVVYREVATTPGMMDIRCDRDIRPRNYLRHSRLLADLALSWASMPLSTTSAESADSSARYLSVCRGRSAWNADRTGGTLCWEDQEHSGSSAAIPPDQKGLRYFPCRDVYDVPGLWERREDEVCTGPGDRTQRR